MYVYGPQVGCSKSKWAFQTRVCRHHGRCHSDGKAINILGLEDTYTPHCKAPAIHGWKGSEDLD